MLPRQAEPDLGRECLLNAYELVPRWYGSMRGSQLRLGEHPWPFIPGEALWMGSTDADVVAERT
jgi:hypothetical protein